MDSSTQGAMSEYLVVIDLIKRGFEVYRNASPTGATDIIAVHTTKTLQVTTMFVQVKTSSSRLDDREKVHNDVVAVVRKDGSVRYKTTPGLTYLFEGALLDDGVFHNVDSFKVIDRIDPLALNWDKYQIGINGLEGAIHVALRDPFGKLLNKMSFMPPKWMHINPFGDIVSEVSNEIIAKYQTADELERLFAQFPKFVEEKLLIWRQKSEEGFITSEVYKEVTRSNS